MSNNLQSMALSVPHSGSIEGYIQAVSSIDMLSAEEERELAVRLREDEDLQAARKLVMSHCKILLRLWLTPSRLNSRRQYWSDESR